MAEGTEKRVRPKSSKVWEHFTLKPSKKSVRCRICGADLAWHGSTSSLREHLKRRHVGAMGEGDARKKPPTGDDRVLKETCTPQQAAVLTDGIMDMLVTDMRPLSMVEDEGFRKMINTFNPGYALPPRTYFSKLMEKKYKETFQGVKSAIKATNKIALTTDLWTSVATEAYLGITCHYIGDDWDMKSVCLTTVPLEDRHTASNIAERLEEVAARFEIPPSKIIAIVHDNGANIVAAAKILEERHGWSSVRCTGHTLQLVMNSALKHSSIDKAIRAARCLVEHLKNSELASNKLRQKQQQMGTPEHKLVQDISTRWNSTYHMVSRLLEQRWPVTATLSDSTVTQRDKHYLDLKDDQWGLLEELSTALEPFECATVFMSGDKYTTISTVPPLVKGLVKSTQRAAFETAAVKAFQVTATEQLQQRWKNDTTFSDTAPNTMILSSALDPRFRKLKFLTPEEVVNVQIKIQTHALGVSTKMERDHDQATASTSTITKAASGTTTLYSILDSGTSSEEEQREGEAEDLDSQVRNEILTYFGEKPLAKEENPLHWWKANGNRYPNLARIAKSYLCIPGTSTPSEHLFSAAGNIASKRRAGLSPEHVDMLTFLHCNANFSRVSEERKRAHSGGGLLQGSKRDCVGRGKPTERRGGGHRASATGTQKTTDVGVGTYNEAFSASGLLASTPIKRPCKRPCLELGEEEEEEEEEENTVPSGAGIREEEETPFPSRAGIEDETPVPSQVGIEEEEETPVPSRVAIKEEEEETPVQSRVAIKEEEEETSVTPRAGIKEEVVEEEMAVPSLEEMRNAVHILNTGLLHVGFTNFGLLSHFTKEVNLFLDNATIKESMDKFMK